ncbi:tRNA (guanosine(37)-N1)-methyltransferase TrmD [Candidatus Giovannonibacteria bacterium RIFCSPHIGHO2_01_FULL_45_24]|uniref:tRNA (guanine-N(1)-)-methyltransferase n=1 Tax=Candidatus Giovannonibacteria bacterium RIFCSPLOWO2_01_FULL_46_32 TaxID=1798353 RepID=A0A1F5XHJ5_9BACT|nr:MAG: tRNA (guanosine(37)-N1)-methyltransferase TrmD [Candidatus Giovannonibacteria bacterium RIFCSPHIGHO2_01_FULL_45_24]OGF87337.1 MAG: tRNA (guanosine(37)-N1)-methyltransferase TrmD [Candidatus Giovannonibacteria bacterium RIFCSPLOWO2_01_FULL_46_32]
MRFDIITIFPKVFRSYFNESIISRAQKRGLAKIKIWDLKKFLREGERVDDRPYGGGPGMVLKIEPIAKALDSILQLRRPTSKSGKTSDVLITFLSASGKQFNSKMAGDFAKKYKWIIFICGHYEGVDERVKSMIENLKLKIENLSIGPYVLTGGELPAMVVVDAVLRKIPGVLGKYESLEEKRHGIGVPVYTRPEIFKWKGGTYKVTKILLSGNHKKIGNWRIKHKIKNKALQY